MNNKIIYFCTVVLYLFLISAITISCGKNGCDITGLEPLPANGFKALITAGNVPANMKPSQIFVIVATVKNESDVVWETSPNSADVKMKIQLGERWLDKNGKEVKPKESRSPLLETLNPGKSTNLKIKVSAPKEPGNYTLELDMVQEYVAWFKQKGSKPLMINITVK